MKRFGEYVKEARKLKGWTLQRLAWEIRSHKGYVSGIENDKVNPPSAKVIEKLCRKLDLPVAQMQAVAFIEKRPEAVSLDAMSEVIENEMKRLLDGPGPASVAS